MKNTSNLLFLQHELQNCEYRNSKCNSCSCNLETPQQPTQTV